MEGETKAKANVRKRVWMPLLKRAQSVPSGTDTVRSGRELHNLGVEHPVTERCPTPA
jgi:hypothetical protein